MPRSRRSDRRRILSQRSDAFGAAELWPRGGAASCQREEGEQKEELRAVLWDPRKEWFGGWPTCSSGSLTCFFPYGPGELESWPRFVASSYAVEGTRG